MAGIYTSMEKKYILIICEKRFKSFNQVDITNSDLGIRPHLAKTMWFMWSSIKPKSQDRI
jgi:hypothetical protein